MSKKFSMKQVSEDKFVGTHIEIGMKSRGGYINSRPEVVVYRENGEVVEITVQGMQNLLGSVQYRTGDGGYGVALKKDETWWDLWDAVKASFEEVSEVVEAHRPTDK